jgi:hypothetical protein
MFRQEFILVGTVIPGVGEDVQACFPGERPEKERIPAQVGRCAFDKGLYVPFTDLFQVWEDNSFHFIPVPPVHPGTVSADKIHQDMFMRQCDAHIGSRYGTPDSHDHPLGAGAASRTIRSMKTVINTTLDRFMIQRYNLFRLYETPCYPGELGPGIDQDDTRNKHKISVEDLDANSAFCLDLFCMRGKILIFEYDNPQSQSG